MLGEFGVDGLPFLTVLGSVGKVLLQKSKRNGCPESQLSQQRKASLSPLTNCDNKGQGRGEGNEGEGT